MTAGDDPVLAPLAPGTPGKSLTFATTLALGAIVYLLWDVLHRMVDAGCPAASATFGLAGSTNVPWTGFRVSAAFSTRALQHGRSPGYMAVAAAAAVLAIGLPAGGSRACWPGRPGLRRHWAWPVPCY